MTVFIIKEVYPHNKPNQYLPADVVNKMQEMYVGDRYRNPELHKVNERCAANFDSYFGAGEYYRRYPSDPTPVSKAAMWNWDEYLKMI